MLRKAISLGAVLLLAGAVVLVTPNLGQAQRGGHGGGHGGGMHFGGAHGGFHSGGAHFGGAHFHGFHSGFHNGAHFHNGFHNGFHPHTRFFYSYPYYSYPYYSYPYYGNYGYYPYSYNYAPYYYGTDSDDSSGYYSDDSSNGSTLAAPPASDNQSSTVAHLTVKVPADAQVWFDDKPTTTTGSVRHYTTPSLEPGHRYSYEIRARWKDHGQEVTQSQRIRFTAGANVEADFPMASTATPNR
jgi:uncharacterized protein (TIGR03000 family)